MCKDCKPPGNPVAELLSALREVEKKMSANPFDVNPSPDNRRSLDFDVTVEVAYDWSADRAPNPMDEADMIKLRIEECLRREFPNGEYKIVVEGCDC